LKTKNIITSDLDQSAKRDAVHERVKGSEGGTGKAPEKGAALKQKHDPNAAERKRKLDDQDALTVEHRARSMVIVPIIRDRNDPSLALATRSEDARLDEAIGLASAIDLDICQSLTTRVNQPRPSHLFGAGKVDELGDVIKNEDIELVIIDHALTPGQQRNLEQDWNAKVLDRTGLILEIFADRAQTREGTLQVELAHLTYQKTRLVRSWTHLERQRGGVGFMGGPGETQIEADKRHLGARIDAIKRDLKSVTRTRELHRAGRKRVPYPIVALVGYTNAGKSTLFNHLTDAQVFAKDQLFATLDPTMREVALPGGQPIILSDTVGFISDLPTTLIAAFRATLEEVLDADLILHVRDIAHQDTEAQRLDVIDVLKELGIDIEVDDHNIMEVWNKLDLLDPEAREVMTNIASRGIGLGPDDHQGGGEVPVTLISAVTGEGVDQLLETISNILTDSHKLYRVSLTVSERGELSWLYNHGHVQATTDLDDGGVICDVTLAPDMAARFQGRNVGSCELASEFASKVAS